VTGRDLHTLPRYDVRMSQRSLAGMVGVMAMLAAACGDDAGGASGSGGRGGAQAASTSVSSGAGGAGEGGGVPLPTSDCQLPCTATTDCGVATHWSCTDGFCLYLGCAGDEECGDGFACRDGSCVQACETSECGENNRCEDGACVWLGCDDDGDCQSDLSEVCRLQAGSWSCLPGCAVDDDCAGRVYGPYLHQCVDGVCHYLGCPDDAACQEFFNDPRMVCAPW
jgi:hypothetical protein